MIRLLADENFNGIVVRALLLRRPELDIIRVQEVGLSGAPDAAVLAWAAEDRRIVLTHDVSTMTRDAYERLAAGLPMPGVIEVPDDLPIGRVIDDLLLIIECSQESDLDGQVGYLPLSISPFD